MDKKLLERIQELSDILLESYKIKIIPKSAWMKGKIDPTEYSDETNTIKVRSDYDWKNDPAGWIVHEKAHADFKGSHDWEGYPDNPVERYAYGKQFQYLKSKGYDFDDIFNIPTMEHKIDYKDFFKKLWNKVNE